MKTAFEIRAVQLDLARHYETIEYLEHYFEQIAAQQFNTVVLYLEGRVRTESFPDYPEESYSVAEMEKLVECAAISNTGIT